MFIIRTDLVVYVIEQTIEHLSYHTLFFLFLCSTVIVKCDGCTYDVDVDVESAYNAVHSTILWRLIQTCVESLPFGFHWFSDL